MMTYYILVFVYGLLIGSFLNVVIYRVPNELSIVSPPSHCTNCEHRLAPLDLVPVFSYLFLRGKCRYCGVSYSSRYMGVELLNAIVYALLLWRFQTSIFQFVCYAIFMSILIAVFFIDYDHKIIPDELVIAGICVGAAVFIYNFFYPIDIFADRNWWNPLVGMVSGSGFLLLVAILGALIYKTEDAMGMGDVKIFAPIGLMLGWKMTIIAMFFSVVAGGFISTFFLITKIKDRKDMIPFGPFIVAGTFFTILFGLQALDFYLNIVLV